MPYSNNTAKLIKELEEGYVLYLDNDCCYTSKPYCDDAFYEDDDEGTSYNFGPLDLVVIFASELNYATSYV